jgi:hypothetical protein
MNVIGHAYERIAIDIGKFVYQFQIPTTNHPPCIIQPHFTVDDFPKQAFPVLGADGDEIGPGLGIIVSL